MIDTTDRRPRYQAYRLGLDYWAVRDSRTGLDVATRMGVNAERDAKTREGELNTTLGAAGGAR